MRRIYLYLIPLIFGLFACETPYTPDLIDSEPEIVVEGYIEAGSTPTPPFVILTYTQPFISTFDQEALGDIFISGAQVMVSDGESEVLLQELCFDDLTPLEKFFINEFIGLDLDSVAFNFCVYIDRSFSMVGEEGKTYELEVSVDNRTVRSTTTIPFGVPLDSFYFVRPTQDTPDSLLELRCFLSDPKEETNFYRYLTREDDGPFIPGFTSVLEDALFNGKTFEFPLPKGEPRFELIDPAVFGYYKKGTQTTIKWSTIDEDQYNFWLTLEFNQVNQGPFSTTTQVDSNIEGGLGIWGGLSSFYYELVVKE